MSVPTSLPQVICRPATQADQADVTEFCKGIWEGDDYVPQVWQDWLQDPGGLLAVAEYQGHAIGCAKVTRIATGQWWLEGFRVDPSYQGLKVGSHLHQHVTGWWLENGEGVVRLMTDALNFPVHHLCEKTGYTKTGEVCGYRAIPLEERTGRFVPVHDLEDAAAFALQSEALRTTNGLTDLGWRICKPSREVFENHAGEGAEYSHRFYWWKGRQGMFSAWEDEDRGKRTFFLGVVACELRELPALLTDVRRFAAAGGFDSVYQIAFDLPQLTSPLLAAGFEKHWKRSNAFVFEKVHPDRA